MNKLFYEEDLVLKLKEGEYVVDWVNSIGREVRFVFNDVYGKLKIVNYSSRTGLVLIEYNNIQYSTNTSSLKKCQLTNLFSYVFLYHTGDIVNNLKITECFFKKRQHKEKWYKYICLRCGWDNGEISESNLKNGRGCSCCRGLTIVSGINDIPTTEPWMVDYFQGGCDEAKLYHKYSTKTIFPMCPDCNRIKNKPTKIYEIYTKGGISCNCSNSNSYPNKFIYSMLNQLDVDFQPEKRFEWAKYARYDFVFYSSIMSKSYLIEADGKLGHGDTVFSQDEYDRINSKYTDFVKDVMAEKYGYELIRIDCKKSDKNYISNNILKSKLSCLLDLSKVDWDKCNEYATSNIVKEICVLYQNGEDVNTLADKYKYNKTTIRKYLHRGTELGWCQYDSKSNTLKAGKENGHKNAKPILIYNSNHEFICEVKSITYLVEHSNEIINTSISEYLIRMSCKNGTMRQGYYFQYKQKEK